MCIMGLYTDYNSEIHHGTRLFAAQNFTMPAMSPTMTEGNIASWKVKEGTLLVDHSS